MLNLLGETVRAFDAQKITNSFLIDLFSDFSAGQIVLKYDDKMLVRTIDGLLKVIRYKVID